MEDQHLNYFAIENFKRFDKFEMDNLGQFNLIVGDNNVGKTTVLESLCFGQEAKSTMSNYFSTYELRKTYTFSEFDSKEVEKSNFWKFIFKDISKPIIIYTNKDHDEYIALYIHTISELKDENNKSIEKLFVNGITELLEQIIKYKGSTIYNDIVGANFENSNFESNHPFISANTSYSLSLPSIFSKYFDLSKNRRKEVIDYLKIFIPKIDDIRIIKLFADQDSIGITLSDADETFALSQFGDGTVKFTRLLLELIINQNNRLMVDEIGVGIHFTQLKSYWNIILKTCKKYNVQLFATTHSLECQQAFAEALDDLELKHLQKEARSITLIETKKGEVKSVTYDFDQFESAMSMGFNTRGGNI